MILDLIKFLGVVCLMAVCFGVIAVFFQFTLAIMGHLGLDTIKGVANLWTGMFMTLFILKSAKGLDK